MEVATEVYDINQAPFPARSRTQSSSINGFKTTATYISFSDRIFITVTQDGRLAHWVHVPLDITATDAPMISHAGLDHNNDEPASDLLPMHHLTATTILGGTIPDLEVLGQTLATQVASAIKIHDERETRMVVLGMGLDRGMVEKQAFGELIGLILGVL